MRRQLILPMSTDRRGRAKAPPVGPEFRGLTFFRGWAEAIVRPVPVEANAPCPKRIENRPVPLNPRHFGSTWITIRTGLRIDNDGLRWMRDTYGYPWADDREKFRPARAGCLIGAFRVDCVHSDDVERPWYRGSSHGTKKNFGWSISEVVPFEDDPVEFKPSFCLGLFRLDEAASRAVESRIERAVRGRP